MRLIDADKLANSLKNNLQSFEEMISEHGKGLAHGTRIALGLVKEQPTISPESLQPQWIPVEERLPDVYRDEKGVLIPFLVSGAGGKYPRIAVYNNGIWSAGLFRVDVTAWMPLPSVYKSKDKEE